LNRNVSNIRKQFDFIEIEEKLYEHLNILFEESQTKSERINNVKRENNQ